MGSYLIKRLFHAVFVVFGVSFFVFVLMFLSGDPTLLMLPGDGHIDQAAIDEFRREMGFDLPFHEQYFAFVSRLARGDIGDSWWQKQPAMGLVLARLPATAQLAGAALLVSLLIGVPLGIIAALKRGTVIDSAATILAVSGNSLPTFWLGIVLILVVSVWLGWFPASGRGGIEHLVLPAFTLGALSGSVIARLLRSSMLEVLSRDFVRTARAKGVRQSRVVLRHVLRNAALPVVTVVGLQVGNLLSGAIVTETVFAYPGMGLLAIQAITNRDMPVVQAFVMLSAVIVLAANLSVDLVYMLIDPRIRYA